MSAMIKAGSYYIPLYSVRELYFSEVDENLLHVVRNTDDAEEFDDEVYYLTNDEQVAVLSKLEKLSR